MTTVVNKNYDNLERALNLLRKNVANCSIGVVTVDDYRPIEDKIEIIRGTLKRLRARILMFKVRRNLSKIHRKPTSRTIEESNEKLQNVIARKLISDNALKQCCHSIVINEVMVFKTPKAIYEQMYEHMKELFLLNETILSLHNSIEIAFKKQLDLKIQCQKSIINYHKFLKEQAEQRQRRLQKTVPRVVKNRERMMKTIEKINVTKKFITNLIATSGKLLQEPFLLEMLEQHAELINEETIIKLTENENLRNKETIVQSSETSDEDEA